ncbi:fluoride efflux transporter CrcB [Rhizobium sp. RU36D]|uniref:fluoride efflux transporter CrcB n=1 Tax=Rhizobium sp. RU36D TaxID=1907415 RepID=UPI0009D7EEC6|nr:fluoride efflux transporter CrcB [Rhizobium sp. RU36D]SMC82011.1 camphor resistance protein CrcB [Rhizobium sp. RU36D]
MLNLVLVGVGGAVGSICRYLVGMGALRLLGPAFPWGTLIVNLFGSFLIGVLVELIVARFAASSELRLFLVTGFLGGFTTFSSFSLDAFALYERGEVVPAFAYVAASLVLSLAAVAAGVVVTRSILQAL